MKLASLFPVSCRIKKLEAKSKHNEMQLSKLTVPLDDYPIQLAMPLVNQPIQLITPTKSPCDRADHNVRDRTDKNKAIDREGTKWVQRRSSRHHQPMSPERTYQSSCSFKKHTPTERARSQGGTCKLAEDDTGMGRSQEPAYSPIGELRSPTASRSNRNKSFTSAKQRAVKGSPVLSLAVLSEVNDHHRPSNMPNSDKENRRSSGEYLSRQSRKRKLSLSADQCGEVIKHRNQMKNEDEKLDLLPHIKNSCEPETISSVIGVSQVFCSNQAAVVSEIMSLSGHYQSCLPATAIDSVSKLRQSGGVTRDHKEQYEPVSDDKMYRLEEERSSSACASNKDSLHLSCNIQSSSLTKHEKQEVLTSQIFEDTLEHQDKHLLPRPELDIQEQPKSFKKVQALPEVGIVKRLQDDANSDHQDVPVAATAGDSSTHSVNLQEDIEEGELRDSDTDDIIHKEDSQEGAHVKQSDHKHHPRESPNSHRERRQSSHKPIRKETTGPLKQSQKENGKTKKEQENTLLYPGRSKSSRNCLPLREPRMKELVSRSSRGDQRGGGRYQREYSWEKQERRTVSRFQTRKNN